MSTSMRYEIKALNCVRYDTLSKGAKVILSMLEDTPVNFKMSRFRDRKFFKNMLPNQVHAFLSELVAINVLTCKRVARRHRAYHDTIYTQINEPKNKLYSRASDLPELFSVRDIRGLPLPGVGSVKTIHALLAHAIDEGYIISHATHTAGANKRPCIKYSFTSKAKEIK